MGSGGSGAPAAKGAGVRASLGWAPAAVLAVGAVLATAGVKAQRALPLRTPLAVAVPRQIDGLSGRDLVLSEAEVRVAGVTTYLARAYRSTDSGRVRGFSLYVGYYDWQTQRWTPVTVYGTVIVQPPNASGRVIDVYIDNQLSNRVRW